jgi:hypothetical protein
MKFPISSTLQPTPRSVNSDLSTSPYFTSNVHSTSITILLSSPQIQISPKPLTRPGPTHTKPKDRPKDVCTQVPCTIGHRTPSLSPLHPLHLQKNPSSAQSLTTRAHTMHPHTSPPHRMYAVSAQSSGDTWSAGSPLGPRASSRAPKAGVA